MPRWLGGAFAGVIVGIVFYLICQQVTSEVPAEVCTKFNGWQNVDSGQCFIPVNKTMRFADAVNFCRSYYHRELFLASIHGASDMVNLHRHIRKNFPNIKEYYIGLNKLLKGYLTYPDYSPPKGYIPHVLHFDAAKQCVKISVAENFYWDTVDCEKKLYFVCANMPRREIKPPPY